MNTAWHCVRCGTPKNHPHSYGRIFLVRHGQTDGNKAGVMQGHTDVPLNEEGIAQARSAAESLKDKKIDLIVSSDLVRAKMTAEIIAGTSGVEVVFDQKLRERYYGVAEGMLRPEFKEKYPEAFTRHDSRLPDGESYSDVEQRVHAALALHRKTHRHKNIVIVTHGGVLRMVFKLIREWNWEQTIAYSGTPNAVPLELEVADPCPQCGSDLYEDPVALEEFLAKRTNDPIYQKKK